MKVSIEKIPEMQDLERAYDQILLYDQDIRNLNISEFAKFCQWSRFDSRLGEICVGFLTSHWTHLNPVELRNAFNYLAWPNILGVLLEFCSNDSKTFSLWKKLATCGFSKANWEQFFIGARRMGGALMFDDARLPLMEYQKWGYLSRERLVRKPQFPPRYAYSVRVQILKDLLKKQSRLKTSDYWEAVDRSVSKRQAERDLHASGLVKQVGQTKGSYFIKRGLVITSP